MYLEKLVENICIVKHNACAKNIAGRNQNCPSISDIVVLKRKIKNNVCLHSVIPSWYVFDK